MKNIKLSFFFVWCLSLVSILVFVGCNQDEVETSEEQFKPLKIQITSSVPIQSYDGAQGFDQLALISEYGQPTLSSSVANNIGENTIEINTTAKRNKVLNLRVMYNSYFVTNNFQTIGNCSDISVKIYFDGQLVYNQLKEMGGVIQSPVCPDGYDWSLSYTIQ